VFAGYERIVGSVANLIVAERARPLHGVIIGFRSYFVVAAPLTILSILFGAFWLSLN
jgi:Na+/H+ antiporter NhaD/arsenite permease-like protein